MKQKKELTLRQKMHRMQQRGDFKDSLYDYMDAQLKILEQLYKKHDLELCLTSTACPEQYDVYKNGKEIAYYRLRNGRFRVDYPDVDGETIYEAEPVGDGSFHKNERFYYLTKAMWIVLSRDVDRMYYETLTHEIY